MIGAPEATKKLMVRITSIQKIDPAVVTDWGERLKEMCEGYAPKDIIDESGLLFIFFIELCLIGH